MNVMRTFSLVISSLWNFAVRAILYIYQEQLFCWYIFRFPSGDLEEILLYFTENKDFSMNKSSRPDAFCKISVLKSFAKFSRRQLCRGLF